MKRASCEAATEVELVLMSLNSGYKNESL